MPFVFDLVYVDYSYPSNSPARVKHTVANSVAPANTGANYDNAAAVMATALSNAQDASLANVYAENLRWRSSTAYVASSDIAANANTQLSVQFGLTGKKQTAKYAIPAIDETLVRGADRRVDNSLVAGLDLIVEIIGGDYVVSDGDTVTGVRDADLVTVKGRYQE